MTDLIMSEHQTSQAIGGISIMLKKSGSAQTDPKRTFQQPTCHSLRHDSISGQRIHRSRKKVRSHEIAQNGALPVTRATQGIRLSCKNREILRSPLSHKTRKRLRSPLSHGNRGRQQHGVQLATRVANHGTPGTHVNQLSPSRHSFRLQNHRIRRKPEFRLIRMMHKTPQSHHVIHHQLIRRTRRNHVPRQPLQRLTRRDLPPKLRVPNSIRLSSSSTSYLCFAARISTDHPGPSSSNGSKPQLGSPCSYP